MRNRLFLSAATLAVLLLAGTPASAAVFIVPPDDELIADADAIVVADVESGYGSFATNGDIVTNTRLNVVSVLKGNLTPGTLEIRDLGGEVGSRLMGVSGGVTYRPGERALLFLQRERDGGWTTYGMILGKFQQSAAADGRQILMRGIGNGVLGLRQDGSAHLEQPRDAVAFINYIRREMNEKPTLPRKVKNEEFVAEIDVPVVSTTSPASRWRVELQNHYSPSAYTQGTFRWALFDAGQSVSYRVSGSQPGYDSLGAAQRALAAWTNDPRSNVNVVYGGTSSALFVEDSQNTIVFNSATDVPAGAIGYSKWYANATHTFKGQTFYSISEGDVVMRAGLSVSQLVFDEAVAHEVGHTLGFRHSDQGTPASQDAVMRSAVTGRFGANLGPWDQEAVNHVYGDGTFIAGQTPPPPTCTAPAITTQPGSTTITRGTSVTLTVVASGTAPLTYQWYVGTSGNTASPTGTNSPSLTVTPTTTTSDWVRVTNSCGTANSTTATITVTVPGRVRGDFNGDGYADLLWRNKRTGENKIWLMQNQNRLNSVALPSVPDVNWRIVGAGDFNGDTMQDIFWHNTANGQTVVWFMSNTTNTGSATTPTVADLSFRPESVNDWNHDGRADVIWRNYATGQNIIWFMNGTSISSSAALPGAADPAWHIVGTGDTNNDNNEDIIWRNFSTGQNLIFWMNGLAVSTTPALQTITDQNWQIGAVVSFNGDPFVDFVWRNYANGRNSMWFQAHARIGSSADTPLEPNLDWELSGPR